MKFIYNCILIISSCFLNVSSSYGSEHIEANKIIQSLSISKKEIQVDSLAILRQQEKMIATLLEKQEAFELKHFVLIGIVLFLVILFGMLCFLNKRGDKRLNKIVSLLEKTKQENVDINDKKDTSFKLNIDPVIVHAILENLKAFENEKGFLNTKITLHSFAKKLQTNTKYLSKVINTHKLKSFRNYINDLRVQYSIEELQNNTNYKNYTVHAMAQEAGFSNRESFSKAFRKKTGETVSDFLKQAP
ncbi:DNA-binding transcriptional activator FeaR [Kordia sp. SMS9]|uniref:helix-turn-helix domain-containing protein n=1 Tax=Kordia sp. SMS9 TaxID=2282170 RepID=UPI000E0D1DFF|nr:helix-turn-helix transcriptional regulator [Kordia sp. SMS9]AXG68198.1 DNA-binding transcriptional activator FeaR [Kordia sp. SMS9]